MILPLYCLVYSASESNYSLTSWGMREVTEDSDICKGSVFHRLLQRALPGWFPYDSIRFFHPFYTSEQNAMFAQQQGYFSEFKVEADGTDKETGKPRFNVTASMPQKPPKPVYLKDFDRISTVLNDKTGEFVHPALQHSSNFPHQIQKLLDAGKSKRRTPTTTNCVERVHEDKPAILHYFNDTMRYIIKRESITMNNTTYQLDATRE